LDDGPSPHVRRAAQNRGGALASQLANQLAAKLGVLGVEVAGANAVCKFDDCGGRIRRR